MNTTSRAITSRLLPLLAATGLITGCVSDSGYYSSRYDPYDDSYVRCDRCGEVTRIDRIYGERRSSGSGALVGAIVGGVLGSNVGSGHGRRAATAAGVVLGSVAGNEIEKDNNARGGFALEVRMDDGRRVVVEQTTLAGIREGDRVVLSSDGARLL